GETLLQGISKDRGLLVMEGEVRLSDGSSVAAENAIICTESFCSTTQVVGRMEEWLLSWDVEFSDGVLGSCYVPAGIDVDSKHLKHSASGDVITKTDSILAYLDFDAVSAEAAAAAEAMRQEFLRQEEERLKLVHEVRALRQEIYPLEVRLGIRLHPNVSLLWRKAVIAIREIMAGKRIFALQKA
ncbi:hypothetical protein CYMTET_16395, partial [Cymbomonas tetramitiformis]